ncbi:MAG: hypothetical protein M4579_004193 [Chaenotheca gracillima]|nr:MAG: hypothetical protein M4579_004193 [Chaenotheca gracillima]
MVSTDPDFRPELESRHSGESQSFLVDQTHSLHPELQEPLWQRLGPVASTTLTTIISLGITILHVRNYRDAGQLYVYTTAYRSTVQAFIHVISTLLSFLWTYAVCSMINRYSRRRFGKVAVSLDHLRFWSALSSQRIDINLPIYWAIVSAIFVAAFTLPATIWVGALTPQQSPFNQTVSLPIAKTGNGSYPFLIDGYNCGPAPTYQSNGTFSLCPANHFSGSMLTSARTATPITGSRNHTKFDASRFQYIGRSYGVGSASGLTDTKWTDNGRSVSYTYLESGYNTSARCIYNSSSDWRIDIAQDNSKVKGLGRPPQTMPSVFYAHGRLPNSNWSAPEDGLDTNFAFSDSSGDRILSLGSHNDPDFDTYFVAVAANEAYKSLDKIQCQIFFEPTTFSVAVNVEDASTRIGHQGSAPDPEPRGLLKFRVAGAMDHISEISTTAITSVVGDALIDNLHNMQAHLKLPLEEDNLSDDIKLRAVEDSFNAIMDDFLVSMASVALTMPNATMETTAVVLENAVQIGSRLYIIATLILNILALTLVVIATVKEHYWTKLPMFDYTDLASLSWASALGSYNSKDLKDLAEGTLRHWNGDPADDVLRSVVARFEMGPQDNQIRVKMG